MKKRLARVSPLQLGIVLAVLYGLISLVIVVPMGLIFASHGAIGASNAIQGAGASHAPALIGSAIGGVMIIVLPILYAVMGFIGGVISGAIYNLVAKWTGGIEFTVVDALEQ